MNLKKTIFILIISLVSFSCVRTQESFINHNSPKIEALKNTELKKEFLENIFNSDQKVRNNEAISLQKFGLESSQYKKSLHKMVETDSNNLVTIMNYLQVNEYPDKKTYGEIASMTPWLIFHHYPLDNYYKKRFDILNSAYKNNLVTDKQFEWYLKRFLPVEEEKIKNYTLEELIEFAEKAYN